MIHKSHSKTDLIDLINYCGVPIVFNHSNNKKSLHDKFSDLFKTNTDLTLEPNHFKISSLSDLKFYLLKPNPKKQLSIKEKQDVMREIYHLLLAKWIRYSPVTPLLRYANDS